MNIPSGSRDAKSSRNLHATNELLPIVYESLCRLAAKRLAHDAAVHAFEPAALVHEAYLRLAGEANAPDWDGPGHFFAAAAEAMRRVLVDWARRRRSLKHGGGLTAQPFPDGLLVQFEAREDLLELDQALNRFAELEPLVAELVQLRYFGGLSIPRAAELLGISPRTADRYWAYARAWLHEQIAGAVLATTSSAGADPNRLGSYLSH